MFEQSFTGFSVASSIYYFGKKIPDEFYPYEDYMTRALLWRNECNQNTFLLVVGNPRSSKSSYAIQECERLSRLKRTEFNIRDQLTFDDIRKFLIWSKDAKESVFILDETGTTLSPDQFWSIQQRVMRSFIQTQGFRKNILFWVLPSIVFIQKGFRFLSNYGLKTLDQGKIAIYKIVVDQLLGKGITQFVGTIRFQMPSPAVWNEYTKMKEEWNDIKLGEDIDYLEMMDKPDDRALLRQKNLELTVKLKEKRLETLNSQNKPKEDNSYYDNNM